VGKGDPATGVKAPVLVSIANTLTSVDVALDANRKLPAIVIRFEAMAPPPQPMPPVRNGDPATGVRVPLGATEKAETVFAESRWSSFV
jgi:hypothetical protein